MSVCLIIFLMLVLCFEDILTLPSDFCVLNRWKRDDYDTFSWRIVAAFGCVTSCMMLHLAIAHCSSALGIHVNLKIL